MVEFAVLVLIAELVKVVALKGSSVLLLLLKAEDELRVLVKVPVALTVLVITVVLFSIELERSVYDLVSLGYGGKVIGKKVS